MAAPSHSLPWFGTRLHAARHLSRGGQWDRGTWPCGDLAPGRSWQKAARSSRAYLGRTARWHHQSWDTARTSGLARAWLSLTRCCLQTRSTGSDHAWQHGTPWPCALPAVLSRVTDLSPLLSPDVLAGRGSSDAEGREGLGSVRLCQRRCTVPAAEQRLWGRRDVSGAEQGGGGRWLPAVPPMPGIRCWLCAPRARHSLLARLRDTGKR